MIGNKIQVNVVFNLVQQSPLKQSKPYPIKMSPFIMEHEQNPNFLGSAINSTSTIHDGAKIISKGTVGKRGSSDKADQ